MRLTCVFLVGIATFGCKDKASPQATEAQRSSATPATPTGQPQRPPDQPTLQPDQSFESETRDAAWASSAEQAIKAVAPQLGDVACRQMQCRVTLTAASEAELVAATDKLSNDDSLHGIDGVQSIKLTQPESQGGKFAMKIYVRFNRE